MSESKIEQWMSIQKRVNELGTEYRRLFMIVASGLFVGSLLKNIKISDTNEASWGTLVIGLSAVGVLANVLWSKHRSVRKRDAIGKEIGKASGNYLFSVAFWDLIMLLVLVAGIILAVCGVSFQSGQ